MTKGYVVFGAAAAVGLASAFMIAAPQPASAKVRCDNGFQIQKDGSSISTPYCEDKLLYDVATRSFGVRTSFRKIRNDIHEKEEVCRVVGGDSRVISICLEFRNGGRRRF